MPATSRPIKYCEGEVRGVWLLCAGGWTVCWPSYVNVRIYICLFISALMSCLPPRYIVLYHSDHSLCVYVYVASRFEQLPITWVGCFTLSYVLYVPTYGHCKGWFQCKSISHSSCQVVLVITDRSRVHCQPSLWFEARHLSMQSPVLEVSGFVSVQLYICYCILCSYTADSAVCLWNIS